MARNQALERSLHRWWLPTGLKALWFRVTGKYRAIKKQNESEASQCKLRDQAERQKLIDQQLRERRKLQHDFRLLRHQHGVQIKKLNRDMEEYLKISPENQANALRQNKRRLAHKRQIRQGL